MKCHTPVGTQDTTPRESVGSILYCLTISLSQMSADKSPRTPFAQVARIAEGLRRRERDLRWFRLLQFTRKLALQKVGCAHDWDSFVFA